MYCACGVKKVKKWKCECDWEGWFLCYPKDWDLGATPIGIPVKEHPDKEGKYLVRICVDGDDSECESQFCLTPKNWGLVTNGAISRWDIEYDDKWMGYIGVYAWKEGPLDGMDKDI